MAACGACDGFAQGALLGEAALLPPQYTQALVSGTAASGTQGRVACWSLVSKVWGQQDNMLALQRFSCMLHTAALIN